MKISDGNWLVQPNFTLQHPAQVYQYHFDEATGKLTVYAPAKEVLSDRANQINCTLFTIEVSAPDEGVIGVKFNHHMGLVDRGPHHELNICSEAMKSAVFTDTEDYIELKSGSLACRFSKKDWKIDFLRNGQRITGSEYKSTG